MFQLIDKEQVLNWKTKFDILSVELDLVLLYSTKISENRNFELSKVFNVTFSVGKLE